MDLEATAQKNESEEHWEPDHSVLAELERAKDDLELVSYIASHDLEAPLRTILHACDEMKSNRDVVANSDACHALDKITGEAGHLKLLLSGLLEYMRLTTYAPSYAMLDINEIVTASVTALQDKIRDAKAKVVYSGLPQVEGHRGRMTRLFVSLLDNALKFNTSGAPEIRITAQPQGSYLEFCVEDNGIGIDEEYHNIVFTLYQRLHTEAEYPGYGIGLALCKKIVESHGGKMWVESAIGTGSRFRFLLPVAGSNK